MPCVVLATVTVAALSVSGSLPAAGGAGTAAVRRLAIGSPVSTELAGGETVAFSVELAANRAWRLTVEQQGIDVLVEVKDGSGQPVVTVDRPLDRDGSEVVLLDPKTPQLYRFAIRSPLATAPAGRVRVAVEAIDRSTLRGRNEWLAEKTETEAAAAYARGDAEGRRQAILAYRRALRYWQLAEQGRREALAVYSLGVIHRLLGEAGEALELAELSESRFAELDEPRWRASALNEIGLARLALGELAAARAAFARALELLASAPDPFREAVAQSNVCLVALHLGELRAGIECYERAASLYLRAGDPQSEAMAQTNSGQAYKILGEQDRALASFERALAIQRASGDASGEALTLNNLAVLHASRGDLTRALTLYGRAADLYRTLDKKDSLALALSNTGTTYWSLGETERARSFFEQALELQRAAEDRRGQALTLTNLARIYDQQGEPDRARTCFEEALDLRRRTGNRIGEGHSLLDLGSHQLTTGDLDGALESFEGALVIARELGDREGEGRALARVGDARLRSGELEQAGTALASALGTYRVIGAEQGVALVLTSMARLERQRGHPIQARGHVVAALKILESLRARIASPELRASFLASRRQAFELEIALLMELHRGDPDGGYQELALAASERARARSLLELLGESGDDLRGSIDPDLLRDRQRLLNRLEAADRARRRSAEPSATPDEAATGERAVETILAELDRLDGEIRAADPVFASLVRPAVLDAAGIQALLSPRGQPETVFLVYSLGTEKSFLWWVEADSIQAFELPAQETIEALARRVFEGLSTLDPTSVRAEAQEAAALSAMILGPVADRLAGQRLAVIADGALHHIPFAALPRPGAAAGASEPLVSRHEVVRLPSASALALQRRLSAGRGVSRQRSAARGLERRRALVVADPVFDRNDSRVVLGPQGVAEPAPSVLADLTRSARQAGVEHFVRLPASLREAQAIAALGSPGEVRLATGFAASREALDDGELASYRVVHFATHGLINDRTPRLSGLVLSQVDERGRPVDGFLRLYDLYNLSLDADLVVLSGCRTASGRAVRGEGLVGLTQGFLYAGARRVMASLWQVQDRATAELMARFYRALWVDGLEPAAALRAAQLSLAGDRRWRDPYYWAGFILQGDWRPDEAVVGAGR
jgi:CHAT domain-containing protein/Tfp pilus assembly protein PilF